MAKITTKNLIGLDYTIEENKNKIQKVLKSLKPLSSFQDEEVPLYALEKIVHHMCYKYKVYIRCISQDCWSNSKFDIWRAELFNDGYNLEQKVYGISLYELFAKLVIVIYSYSKKNKLEERS